MFPAISGSVNIKINFAGFPEVMVFVMVYLHSSNFLDSYNYSMMYFVREDAKYKNVGILWQNLLKQKLK